jgi:broad specificity phosphatase PhoE
MSTLYLIRHGQASYGVANYDQLSPLGVRQAEAIGAALAGLPLHAEPIDAIYAGPLRRQRDTAEHLRAAAAVAGRELPATAILDDLSEYPAFELLRHWVPRLVEEDPAFAALAAGGTERPEMIRLLDRAFDTIIGRWARGELIVPDGVESFAEFAARVQRGIETIVGDHGRGARIAAVTSGGVIGVALRLALDFDHARTLEAGRMVRNASISEFAYRSRGFAWRPGDFSLVGFNHVHHLGALDMITFR